MIYKPYCSSTSPPLTFNQRAKNINLALERKKSHSIKPVLHFSPNVLLSLNQKTADNPQDKRK
jgi:hypothetical protein